MIGKHQLIFDQKDWLRGMSSSTDVSDGGFSTATRAVNLTKEPGIVYGPAARVNSDTDTTLTDEIIASAPDHQTVSPRDRLVVCENGTYLSYNGTKLSAVLNTDGTYTYQVGFTDFINFAGASFITKKERITKWSGTSTFDHSYFTFTNTSLPHPALVYENNAYYGDGNLLLRQTGVSATPTTIITLPSNDIIMALGIDAGTGKMLISTTSHLAISGQLQGVNKLHWYDGSSNKVGKVVIVGDIITSFESVGSTVYVGYGTKLGFINGSGVEFLWQLRNITLDQQQLPYQHKIMSIDGILCVADGDQILAFGNVLRGQRVFWYIYKNAENSNDFKSIFPVGNHKIGLSVTTTKFDTFDIANISTMESNALLIDTNYVNFPRPISVRNLRLEFFSNIASSGNVDVLISDEEKDSRTLTHNPGIVTNVRVLRDYSGFVSKQDSISIRINSIATNAGLKRIIVYYDFVE